MAPNFLSRQVTGACQAVAAAILPNHQQRYEAIPQIGNNPDERALLPFDEVSAKSYPAKRHPTCLTPQQLWRSRWGKLLVSIALLVLVYEVASNTPPINERVTAAANAAAEAAGWGTLPMASSSAPTTTTTTTRPPTTTAVTNSPTLKETTSVLAVEKTSSTPAETTTSKTATETSSSTKTSSSPTTSTTSVAPQSSTAQSSASTSNAPIQATPVSRKTMTKEQYVEAVLREPLEGVLDPEPIRQLCKKTKFREGLIWHCALVNGGIGNVGNMWLNCLRYAIEAGATAIIIPRIGERDDTNLSDLGNGDRSVDLSKMYDVDYFLKVWPDICPQMRAVADQDEISNLPTMKNSYGLKANDVGGVPRRNELILDPTEWRKNFEAWMDRKIPNVKNMSSEFPIRVWQRIALSNWNREVEDPALALALPRLFRFPTKFRRLAAVALYNLEQKTGQPIVPDAILFPSTPDNKPTKSTKLGPGRISNDSYLGVHLRVAADAKKVGWPGYEAQAPAYLDEAARRNLSSIYLATGSAQHRKQFREDAAKRNMTVFTKEDLLNKTELEELSAMYWDQQAIVDYEVLLHSAEFCGFVRSTFSWITAIRRSILPEAGKPVVRRGAPDAIAVKYRDNLNLIVGRYDKMMVGGIWP